MSANAGNYGQKIAEYGHILRSVSDKIQTVLTMFDRETEIVFKLLSWKI